MKRLRKKEKLFFFGVGNTALWVADQADDRFALFGTTRQPVKVAALKKAGIEPILIAEKFSSHQANSLKAILADAYVLVSYPPDPISDMRFGELIDGVKSLVYVSSTGVYGRRAGLIDESTEVDAEGESAQKRLTQERFWSERHAVVLRAPGLYCPASGLHIRLAKGSYRLPGDGSNYTSRIHLKDLGRLILSAFERSLLPASPYLVGDLHPASQIEVVTWLCARMNLPMPASLPLAEAPKSLQANRRVNPAKILAELNFTLEFPSYKEGFAHCLKHFVVPSTT